MILLWFIIGIVLIFAIARYNESNKLFWTLLLAFLFGFAGTKMVIQTNAEKQSKGNLEQMHPTQVSKAMLDVAVLPIKSIVPKTSVHVTDMQNPVGQGLASAKTEIAIAQEKVFWGIRDQPLTVNYFDTS